MDLPEGEAITVVPLYDRMTIIKLKNDYRVDIAFASYDVKAGTYVWFNNRGIPTSWASDELDLKKLSETHIILPQEVAK